MLLVCCIHSELIKTILHSRTVRLQHLCQLPILMEACVQATRTHLEIFSEERPPQKAIWITDGMTVVNVVPSKLKRCDHANSFMMSYCQFSQPHTVLYHYIQCLTFTKMKILKKITQEMEEGNLQFVSILVQHS